MYETPTRGDFQRNLCDIIHKARAKLRAESGRITSSLVAKGLARSSASISQMATCANDLHTETIKMSVELIHEFTKRSQMTPAELGAAARPILENLEVEWLAPLLTNRYPQPHGEQAAAQYSEVFRQRVAGALRDAQIGFSGGRDVTAEPEKTVQANAFRLLRAMEEATRGSSTPVHLGDLRNLGMNEEEAKASYHYLRGKGLIETKFNLAYAARVSAAGQDAIRDAQHSPDQTSGAFPAITYNYYLNVETMTGSNIQQGTTSSQITATQTITTEQLVQGVRNLIGQVERALPTSDLIGEIQQQTKAALAELRAAIDERAPDSGRIQRGLEALKRVMEHASGHLVAAGVLGLITPLLHALPAH